MMKQYNIIIGSSKIMLITFLINDNSHSPCMWSRCPDWSGWQWPLSAGDDIVLHREPDPAVSDWPPAGLDHLHREHNRVKENPEGAGFIGMLVL